ncbi:unnamed protein product [Closterium sp. NIES-64]|nr:unnamed protein product [Closterium sp. NIES-64]
MAHLQYLHAEENYLKATANPLPQCPATSTPCNGTSGCPVLYVYKNCLASEPIGCNYEMQQGCLTTRGVFCREFQPQRSASECRSFCGAQPLTPPCSGHGVCFIVPHPSSDLPVCKDEHPPSFCNPNEGRAECTCDEGYTPGTAAGTCVPQGIASDLSGFQPLYNLLLPQLLPLAVLLLLLLFLLALLPRRINLRPTLSPPTRYFFSKRALAARQAASGV